ncbi:myosin heavy fast skeletal muscle [Paramuricea clavata]|uniref:Myosin heavy fast skeletal muscle n=1 Tax=Paramuricea clavata TaxID=317549 RepID=A0A7D9ECK7_PARCT|nr:myosin heavy fast skeletal muscle [Paramuricea clavata]
MSSTGYEPRSNAKLQRLLFDGDETKYELWEARLLGYLQTIKLKKTILSSAPLEEEGDEAKNEESYAELIQLLDDTSLSLVMRDAAGDGRKALNILRDHYASQGKPRIIALYTELTSLEKGTSETVTDYLIRAERSIMALKNAKETVSDGLVIAMILKGLPDSYKPFVVHITQSTSEITFAMFKSQLKSFEETEKFNCKPKTDQVMKTESPSFSASNYVTCYACGRKGHIMKDCPDKTKSETSKWCSYHKSTTYSDSTCRRHQ